MTEDTQAAAIPEPPQGVTGPAVCTRCMTLEDDLQQAHEKLAEVLAWRDRAAAYVRTLRAERDRLATEVALLKAANGVQILDWEDTQADTGEPAAKAATVAPGPAQDHESDSPELDG